MVTLVSNKSSFIKAQYIFWSLIDYLFSKVVGCGLASIKVIHSFEVEIEVTNNQLYPVLFFLKKHSVCLFNIMVDVICSDMFSHAYRYILNYNLCSTIFNTRVRVFTKVMDIKTRVLSVCALYRSVNWSEREIFDFFGIFFYHNSDLRRILTDYGFKGFPLRKDFPLTGYIDTYYDDSIKKISYRSLELNQEYRNFNYSSVW